MRDAIPVVFESGVFRPLISVELAEGTRAEVNAIQPPDENRNAANWPPGYFEQTAGAFSDASIETDDDAARLVSEFEKWQSSLRFKLAQFRDDWQQPKVRDGAAICESLIKPYFSEEPPKNTDDLKRLYNLYLDHLKTIEEIEDGFKRRRVLY
jgi:predicted DNA-binding antitoxin AbrB/MazE fold protein